jgi:hypothetical protein
MLPVSDAELPVLTVRVPIHLEWKQNAPGGCECVCPFFHKGGGAGCTKAGEPGLFAQVVNENVMHPDRGAEEIGTVVLCRRCYQAIGERAAAEPGTGL